MATIIVTHEVKDFDAWKPGFDSDDANRQNAGISNLSLYRDAFNPNIVTLIADAANIEVIMGMFTNPQMQEMMATAGVVGTPEVKFLNKV